MATEVMGFVWEARGGLSVENFMDWLTARSEEPTEYPSGRFQYLSIFERPHRTRCLRCGVVQTARMDELLYAGKIEPGTNKLLSIEPVDLQGRKLFDFHFFLVDCDAGRGLYTSEGSVLNIGSFHQIMSMLYTAMKAQTIDYLITRGMAAEVAKRRHHGALGACDLVAQQGFDELVEHMRSPDHVTIRYVDARANIAGELGSVSRSASLIFRLDPGEPWKETVRRWARDNLWEPGRAALGREPRSTEEAVKAVGIDMSLVGIDSTGRRSTISYKKAPRTCFRQLKPTQWNNLQRNYRSVIGPDAEVFGILLSIMENEASFNLGGP